MAESLTHRYKKQHLRSTPARNKKVGNGINDEIIEQLLIFYQMLLLIYYMYDIISSILISINGGVELLLHQYHGTGTRTDCWTLYNASQSPDPDKDPEIYMPWRKR